MKRIAFGLLTCCLLLGGTSIYAKSEFALNSDDWYKNKFEIIAEHNSREVLQQGLSLLEDAATTQEEQSMKKAEETLENVGRLITKETLNEMSKYKSEYLQQISDTQEYLLDSEWVIDDADLQEIINEIDNDLLDVLEDILSE